jgi:hypothetical protein
MSKPLLGVVDLRPHSIAKVRTLRGMQTDLLPMLAKLYWSPGGEGSTFGAGEHD